MSFIAGLVWGIVVAGFEVASTHYGPSFGAISLNGNGATGIPAVLVPLAIFWGWTWIANRWSGRTFIPSIAFIAGVYLGVGTFAPIDTILFPQSDQSTLASSIPALLLTGAIFVVPPALIGGALYWVLRSDSFPANPIVLAILYPIGIAIAVVPLFGPIIAGGVIAGTAAGHVWRAAGGRLWIGTLVVLLMAFAVFGIPYLLAGGGTLTPPTFPTPTTR